jgi:transcriptional regulator with XRE-family HTH domain
MTQEEAAQALTRLGVPISKPLYGPIESGRLRPSERVARHLERCFGEPIDQLLKPVPQGRAPQLLGTSVEAT